MSPLSLPIFSPSIVHLRLLAWDPFWFPSHLLLSTLVLPPPSRFGLTELLELRLRRARCSEGSAGWRPLDFANRFRMSVSDTTPERRPDICDPGSAALGTADMLWPGRGDCGPDDVVDAGMRTVGVGGDAAPTAPAIAGVGIGWVAWRRGVAGALGDGDADSAIHIRCEFVATSLATVWASVE